VPKIERVVLLDEAGRRIGTAPKRDVHHAETPLHLAFSCYVFDGAGRLLVSRRATDKATFPGVWTNTACGHPDPAEALDDAVVRRVRQELGVELTDLRLVLPQFRYTAVMDGVLENEMCPVFVARSNDEVRPDPAEVDAVTWVPWPDFARSVLDGSRPVSVWCRAQVASLDALGPTPASWPTADPALLPPAASVA
jgi:isopentenyl-diphosphate delta-isomerase